MGWQRLELLSLVLLERLMARVRQVGLGVQVLLFITYAEWKTVSISPYLRPCVSKYLHGSAATNGRTGTTGVGPDTELGLGGVAAEGAGCGTAFRGPGTVADSTLPRPLAAAAAKNALAGGFPRPLPPRPRPRLAPKGVCIDIDPGDPTGVETSPAEPGKLESPLVATPGDEGPAWLTFCVMPGFIAPLVTLGDMF